MSEGFRQRTLLALGFVGLLFALFAGLEDHFAWLQSLCAFSDGCKEAARITLLRIPLWGWGAVYYSILILATLRGRKWLVWLVAGAAGFEIALVWITVSMQVVCTFCLGNFLVVLLLVAFSFEKDRFWQTLAIGCLIFIFSFSSILYENEIFALAAAESSRERIAAKVGGSAITEEELELPIASRIYDLELQIYRLKQKRLELMISEAIIKKEAEERGMTPDQFIDDVILAGGVEVNEEEVNRYLTENKNRLASWSGSGEELRRRVEIFLSQKKSYDQVMAHAMSLNDKYEVAIHLKEPQLPYIKINESEAPFIGPADAPVAVVEFSDYQCPACRNAHEVAREVRELYKGRIRWVFKDFPLKMHKEAARAAEAARCAGEQGKFWEYQDVLFGSEGRLGEERFVDFARELDLDTVRFGECMESGKCSDKVQEDLKEGVRIGVSGTPTFFVGGRMMTGGYSLERFREMIDRALGEAKVAKQ